MFLFLPAIQITAQQKTWIDSLERHGREVYMPANKYKWDWGQATFLNSLKQLYHASASDNRSIYLAYIKTAMDASEKVANGKHPNAVASAHGIAFLARITGDKNYINKANAIYADYLKIPRASNGGVSHRAETIELWDDTVYMLSMFLLEMYKLTGDEKYIADFIEQFNAHNQELTDQQTGLWVHGWDADSVFYDDGCSIKNWPDKVTHRNDQVWARGNGWVGMALADALETVGRKSQYWKPLEKALVHFVNAVAPYQDKSTGHWYQLISLPSLQGNFLESSCTAMFSYAITKGIQLKILDKKKYLPKVQASYAGLRAMSMRADAGSLVPTRVSGGTCVGDQAYYLGRKIGEGTGFGYGSFIMFGLAYEQLNGKRK
jgi:unsaturated rhamnogalacturonyl hydrolase